MGWLPRQRGVLDSRGVRLLAFSVSVLLPHVQALPTSPDSETGSNEAQERRDRVGAPPGGNVKL